MDAEGGLWLNGHLYVPDSSDWRRRFMDEAHRSTPYIHPGGHELRNLWVYKMDYKSPLSMYQPLSVFKLKY